MNLSLTKQQFDEIFKFDEQKNNFIKQYANKTQKILEISQYKSKVCECLAEEQYNIRSIDFEKLVNSEFEDKYDIIYCISNQLNYVSNLGELAIITKKAFSILKPKGHLILQFINSDRLLSETETDNENAEFQLESILKDGNDFLKIKYNNGITFNITPILFTDVQTLSNRLGAYYVRFYGNFDNSKFFKPESLYLIAVIAKPEKSVDMSKQSACSLI